MYPDGPRTRHFRMDDDEAEHGGFADDERFVEVRYDHHQEDGADQEQWTVDEIVMPGVHLEGMDQDAVWMSVGGLYVWFRAFRVKGDRRPHLTVTCFPEGCTPYVVSPEEATGQGYIR